MYGVIWNPMRPHNGKRGSEFASYGVKHIKVRNVSCGCLGILKQRGHMLVLLLRDKAVCAAGA